MAKEIWDEYVSFYNIDDRTVVLALAGESRKIDSEALARLPHFVRRKKSNRVVVFKGKDSVDAETICEEYGLDVDIYEVPIAELREIYRYYTFAFNLDNIVFTFLEECPYNYMGRILNETDITEDEAVCLGLYCLRKLPGEMENV